VAATRNGQVGVIGTASTINSGAYEDGFAAAPQVRVTSAACPQFVDFVERGITSGWALLELAGEYLAPLQRAEVDTLVLGCTHYPLLAGMIGLVMGDGVTLVSSADETARAVYRTLTERDMFRPDGAPLPAHSFASTGDAVTFARLAARFLGPEAAAAGALDAAAGAMDAAGAPVVAGPIGAAVLAGDRA
jgi:glutamate racemase